MNFKSYNFQQWILNFLSLNNFVEPADIQQQSISLINQNKNVLLSAKTGSGKTFAYCLPIFNKIDLNNKLQFIVLVPTKELAWQLNSVFKSIIKFNNEISLTCLDNNQKQIVNLNKTNVIITTPIKLLNSIKLGLNIKNLKSLVLDEADMLLDYGFKDTILSIIGKIKQSNKSFQTIFASASINNNQTFFYKTIANNLKIISLSKNVFINKNINHYVVYSKSNNNSFETFTNLINCLDPYFAIIFANDKNDVLKIYKYLLQKNKKAIALYKDLDLYERKQIFSNLNKNRYQYLVATDLMSRGIDVEGVSDVINYSLPKEDIWYLHRAGRTGRGKYIGNSYIIYHKDYDNKILRLENKVGKFEYLLIKDNKLVNTKRQIKKKFVPKLDAQSALEIKKIFTKKNLKVKPGYKKKIQKKIYKITQKNKRQYLDNKYKKIRNSKK